MLGEMGDAAHDPEHIYRVLYSALDIAKTEPGTDIDVLIAACLLHDVGRAEEFHDPTLNHAVVGAEKAKSYLLKKRFDAEFASRVAAAISTHRFRSDDPPASIEAKILFDSDKLDATGTMGVARTLLYNGHQNEPLYTRLPDGSISDGSGDVPDSFLHEYHRKLKGLYSGFHTARGAALAKEREAIMDAFYEAMLHEVRDPDDAGKAALEEILE